MILKITQAYVTSSKIMKVTLILILILDNYKYLGPVVQKAISLIQD